MTTAPRTYLYVPGDRPEMLAKAPQRGADALIVDMEDGVHPERKVDARRTVGHWLQDVTEGPPEQEIWIRVNSIPDEFRRDLATIGETTAVVGVVIPKAEDPEIIRELLDLVPPFVAVQPLIETATGILNINGIAQTERVERLQLGEADLTADLGMDPSSADDLLDPVRLQLVISSAAAGIGAPVGPVSTDFKDLDRFEESTLGLKQMGFGARAVIHPAQITVTNRVFLPSASEVERASRLLAAAAAAGERGIGVFVDDDGRMVDEAVLRSARLVVSRANIESEARD